MTPPTLVEIILSLVGAAAKIGIEAAANATLASEEQALSRLARVLSSSASAVALRLADLDAARVQADAVILAAAPGDP